MPEPPLDLCKRAQTPAGDHHHVQVEHCCRRVVDGALRPQPLNDGQPRMRRHGLAAALQDGAGRDIRLGITLNLTNAVPNDPADPVDLDAARRIDALWNRMYLEPILLGAYPADLLEDVRDYGLSARVHDGDLEQISQPTSVARER